MTLAQTSQTNALAALINQIQAMIDTAANGGLLYISTGNLAANQQTYLAANGYVVTTANQIYKISWEPTPP